MHILSMSRPLPLNYAKDATRTGRERCDGFEYFPGAPFHADAFSRGRIGRPRRAPVCWRLYAP